MFYLAMQFGCSTRELLRRVSSSELTEWMAYFLLSAEKQEPKQSAEEQIARMKAIGERSGHHRQPGSEDSSL